MATRHAALVVSAAARVVIFTQTVDDPSGYVDVLRATPKLQRKAEAALKARLKVWKEARELARKATGTTLSVPEPGPAPTLDDMLADQERQRLFRIIEDLVLWEPRGVGALMNGPSTCAGFGGTGNRCAPIAAHFRSFCRESRC